MRRIAVLSDLHCGHSLGVTPPDWQAGQREALQAALWAWYAEQVAAAGPVDLLVCNGDAIDGAATRNGGVELLTTDRLVQVEMACVALQAWRATRVEIVAGTPYHGGQAEDFERLIASELGGGFHDRLDIVADDVRINFRHKVGGSSIMHGRATPALREQVNATLGAAMRESFDGERPDVIVRSHVHAFAAYQNTLGSVFVTPGLQLGSAYAARQCSDLPGDVGFLVFEVDNGSLTWRLHRCTLPQAARPAIRL